MLESARSVITVYSAYCGGKRDRDRERKRERKRVIVSLGSAILRFFFFPLVSPEKERRGFVDPQSGGEIERRADKVSERASERSQRATGRALARSFREETSSSSSRSLSRAMDRDSRSYSCGGCERTAAEGRAMPME